MKGIDIQFIPHLEQRYNTVGDWWVREGTLYIRVSKLPTMAGMFAVALHELIEVTLCYLAGIDPITVDTFDMKMERENPDLEPGDCKDAPYHLQHSIAEACERIFCAAAGLSWSDHEEPMALLAHDYRHQVK